MPGTNSLCIAPALFNKIKFTMELQQENDIDTMGFAVCFKQALNLHEIWLIIIMMCFTNKTCISGLNHPNIRNGLHRNVQNVKIHDSVKAEFYIYSRYKCNIQYEALSQNVTLCIT